MMMRRSCSCSNPLRRLLLLAALVVGVTFFLLANSRHDHLHTTSTYLSDHGLPHLPWNTEHTGANSGEQNQEAPTIEIPEPDREWDQPPQENTYFSPDYHTDEPPDTYPIPEQPHTTFVLPPQPLTYEETQARIKEWVETRPVPEDKEHWPPYDGYREQDYDPNIWESFPWNTDFYTHPGIDQVDQVNSTSVYGRYPHYNSKAWSRKFRGTFRPCQGARGKVLNASDEDLIKPFGILPSGFPNPVIGDPSVTGISFNHCIDRYHRYGPYGFAHGDRDDVQDWQRPLSMPDWTTVDWKSLQDQCLRDNSDRYLPTAREPADLSPGRDDLPKAQDFVPPQQVPNSRYHRRTAVLVRLGEGYKYTEDDLENVRALITELSLLSGAEYQVFILFEVKDDNLDVFENKQLYRDVLNAVPRELRSITLLYSEKLLQRMYPYVGHYDTFWHPYMPVQWFSLKYPEFDHVWNWYPDVRYTGNYYEFLAGISAFAKNAPRKYLWERNQRFHIHAIHGSYREFFNSTNHMVEQASGASKLKPVWGPRQGSHKTPLYVDTKPPRPLETDNFEWGVGEDADLLTLQPIWDPRGVDWAFKDKIWNFLPGITPAFTDGDPMAVNFRHSAFAKLPRRTSIGTHVRLSRRQLHIMHLENLAGRTMAAEMWPATVALRHGLKAVYAPHPVWTDREWPEWYLDAVVNADRGEDAQWGQKSDSIWTYDRSRNLIGNSFFVEAQFPKTLYRRWMGLRRIDASPLAEIGGKPWEEYGMLVQLPNPEGWEEEVLVGGNGRICLPPMLLQPVKDVYDEAPVVGPNVSHTSEDAGAVEGHEEEPVEEAPLSVAQNDSLG
ncbi:Hypothetical predicted protein [Lecanosticta acicola]|uniref:Uncharacterized protein n=1 Tax=Lecanosticta acicola TaxID=111012 RepID=A0AAI8YYV7_9PEZI|nr:Hypothetical predicted protein [Lecanosticta acicola]